MRASAAALALLMLSCFQPELVSGRYRCDRPVTRVVTNECKKLKVMLPCREAATSWSCTQQLSDASHSDKHPGGVLCCKN